MRMRCGTNSPDRSLACLLGCNRDRTMNGERPTLDGHSRISIGEKNTCKSAMDLDEKGTSVSSP
jgi:hypothetical protein